MVREIDVDVIKIMLSKSANFGRENCNFYKTQMHANPTVTSL